MRRAVCRCSCCCFSFYQQLLIPLKLSVTLQLSANKSSDLLPAFSHPQPVRLALLALFVFSLSRSIFMSSPFTLFCFPSLTQSFVPTFFLLSSHRHPSDISNSHAAPLFFLCQLVLWGQTVNANSKCYNSRGLDKKKEENQNSRHNRRPHYTGRHVILQRHMVWVCVCKWDPFSRSKWVCLQWVGQAYAQWGSTKRSHLTKDNIAFVCIYVWLCSVFGYSSLTNYLPCYIYEYFSLIFSVLKTETKIHCSTFVWFLHHM